MIRISVAEAGKRPQMLTFNGNSITLGRASQHELRLTGKGVSSTHCRFFRQGDQFFIEDLGSTNGTYVNRARVQGAQPVTGTDDIVVAIYRLRILTDDQSGASRPPSGGYPSVGPSVGQPPPGQPPMAATAGGRGSGPTAQMAPPPPLGGASPAYGAASPTGAPPAYGASNPTGAPPTHHGASNPTGAPPPFVGSAPSAAPGYGAGPSAPGPAGATPGYGGRPPTGSSPSAPGTAGTPGPGMGRPPTGASAAVGSSAPVAPTGHAPSAAEPAAPEGSGDVAWEREWKQIETLAQAWLSAGQDDGMLLTGDKLKHARQWLGQGRGKRPAPTPLHREFIVAGAKARRGRVLGITSIAALLVGGLGVGGWVLTHSEGDEASSEDDGGAAVATNDAGGGKGPTPKAQTGNRQASDALAETVDSIIGMDAVVATLVATEAVAMLPSGDAPLDAPAFAAQRAALRMLPARPLIAGSASVRAVALSPDGRWAVTSDAAGNVRLWDLEVAGSLKPAYLRGHASAVTHMKVSRSGRWLVTADADGLLLRWDLNERDPSMSSASLSAHRSPITAVHISDGSRWMASADESGEVKVWDLDSATPSAVSMPGPHTGKVTGVSINAAGSRVVSSGEDFTARSWSLKDGRPGRKPKIVPHEELPVTSIALTGDDSTAVTGVEDGTVFLWSPSAGAPARRWIPLASHTAAVTLIETTADSSMAVSASDDNSIVVWDLRAKVPSASSIKFDLHKDKIRQLQLYSPPADVPASRRLATTAFTASDDGTARSWNLDKRFSGTDSKIFFGHEGAVRSVAVSGDGQWAITGGDDGVARVWDWQSLPTTTGDEAPKIGSASLVARGHARPVVAVGVDRFGWRMITGSADGTARVWDLRNPARIHQLPLKDLHKGPVRVTTVSPVSGWAATGDDSGNVVIWDIRDEAPKGLSLPGHTGEIRSIAFTADGKRFASASTDSTVRVWTMGKGIDKTVEVLRHKDEVTQLAISENGKWLIAGALSSVVIWDLTGDLKKPYRTLKKHENDVLSVAAGPKGNWLASGSSDRKAVLYDLSKDKLYTTLLRGHEDEIGVLAFSPDGRYLASGSGDKSIRLWDLQSAHPDEKSLTLSQHEGGINDLQWSRDSRWLVSAANDGTFRIWDTEKGFVEMVEQSFAFEGHAEASVVRQIGLVPGKNERGITRIVSASYDGTARVWPLQREALIKLGCSRAGRALTAEEWDEFVGGAYKPSC